MDMFEIIKKGKMIFNQNYFYDFPIVQYPNQF